MDKNQFNLTEEIKSKIYQSKLFDEEYYLLNLNEEVDNPLEHYIYTGWKKGYNPSKYFDTNCYLDNNPDVLKTDMNPLVHYIVHALNSNRLVNLNLSLPQLKQFRKIALGEKIFDTDYYLSNFDYEILEDPLNHYVNVGSKKGFNPSDLFDADNYLKNNPDVLDSGMNPLVHYCLFGFDEDRKVKYDLTLSQYRTFVLNLKKGNLFDEDYYLKQCSKKVEGDILGHYLEIGWKKGYNPSHFFDTNNYLENNKDVVEKGLNPLKHYCICSFNSNRKVIFNLTLSEIKKFRKIVYQEYLFDDEYYLSNYPDEVIFDPLTHYLYQESIDGNNPSDYFDIECYVKNNKKDLEKTGLKALIHYSLFNLNSNNKVKFNLSLSEYKKFVERVKDNNLFNEDYYRKLYPNLVIDHPLDHFVNIGYKDGKNPSDMFDIDCYLKNNIYVPKNMNPLVYYVLFDFNGSSKVKNNLTLSEFKKFKKVVYEEKLFDDDYYRSQYNENIDYPLEHYLKIGSKKGKNPSIFFNSKNYCKYNNVQKEQNSLVHFFITGLNKNRKVNHDLSLLDLQNFRKAVYEKGFFDDRYYVKQITNETVSDLLEHYLTVGWLEGKNPSDSFNTNKYLAYNKDVAESGMNPLIHFICYGMFEDRLFNFGLSYKQFVHYHNVLIAEELFDDEYYKSQFSVDIVNPFGHYLNNGWKERENPSYLFDVNQYLDYNKDVAKSEVNPLTHFFKHGMNSNRKFNFDLSYKEFQDFKTLAIKEKLFDAEYYSTIYPEISEKQALGHYLTVGWKEGKNPSPFFDTKLFLKNNRDISEKGLNPLLFYVNSSLYSNRKVSCGFSLQKYNEFRKYILENGLFDESYYLDQCSSKIIDPIDHYLKIGWKKGKNPSIKFNTTDYFVYNKDVEEANINPLLHYVQYGIDQDRVLGYGLTMEEFDEFSQYVYENDLFDEEYYLNQCSEENIDNPLLHYLSVGCKKGYDPSLYFGTDEYIRNNDFVKYNKRNPLSHYFKSDYKEEKIVKFGSTLKELKIFRKRVYEEKLFDEDFYQSQYSEKITSDLLEHYIKIGSKNNKRPSIYFNHNTYLENNKDVNFSFKNPLIHYVLFGLNTGRKVNHNLSLNEYKQFRDFVFEKKLFDEEYYLSNVDDEQILDSLEHYLEIGYKEGKNPSWLFNNNKYLELHPELLNNENPLIDYVLNTMKEYNVIKNSGMFDEEFYLKNAGNSFYINQDPVMHFITMGIRWGLDPSQTFSVEKYNETYQDVKESNVNPLYHYITSGRRERRDSFMSLNLHMQKFDKRYNIQTCMRIYECLSKTVSIIIPIYNAYEETKDCITSVFRNTHINYELILIDDCSTDNRISQLLDDLESVPNVKVIRNKKNQGFVKNVNLGMSISNNDVVLLNSDTIVTPHWLSHLVFSAYLSKDTATVTPYSNSSDISIPELGSVKDFKFINKSSYQIDKLSLNNGIESPTGNGFCLFIKREVIEQIGCFDESFGMGYGEETDFTYRAYKNGWKNIRNDSVFVYHRRHASFKEKDSNDLKEKNKILLEERYDDLYQSWDTFVSSKKLKESLARIRYNFKENKTSERLLYVTKLDQQRPVLDDDFLKMSEEYDCYVLALESNQVKFGIIKESRFVLYNKWIIDSKWDKNEFIKLYVNLFTNIKIDLVYIKYVYSFYNPNKQDMSIFVKLFSNFEIPVLYEATVNQEKLLEEIDSCLHPMESLEDLINKKAIEIDFNKYKMVVYTALTGNYDELVTPSVINPKFDYICFTDNPDLKSNFWTIKLMEDSDLDQVRKARKYKILPHKYLKEYDYSLWMDANFDIIGDIEEYIKQYSTNNKLLAIKHDLRNDIYEEAEACIELEKDDPEIIYRQINRYKQQNYPKDNGLIASGILFRKHNDKQVIQLMKNWFSEVYNYSRRDQLSFNYVCWKNNFKYDESKEFYLKNQYFQRLLHTTTDSLSLKYDENRVNTILDKFDEKTSIIIPIYNAYEETKSCIESVLKYTNISYELLLIDDCSTDKRVGELLSSYETNPNIRVIKNKENQGFVKNINLGFENTSNDVVILNSDTEVTPKWLQKLKITAYSDDKVATVTPISNNAGAFSVPKKDEDNEIDPELGILATSNIIEKLSSKDKLYVPTGNGFCMYIRREAIYDVGFFDEIYGMGYCEENDFCMRLLDKNWLHAIDFSTFVVHKHNVSFSTMKEKLFEENRQILEEKHPEYKFKLLDLVNSLDFNNIRDNISRTLTCEEKQKFNTKRILYLIHEGTGGTLHTSIELIGNLQDNIEAYVLTAGREKLKLFKYSKKSNVHDSTGNDDEFLQHLNLISEWDIKSDYTLKEPFNNEFRKIYFNILTALKIDLIHIRHLIRHSFDMPYIANKLKIPVILSFHDFYYICPAHNLIDDKNKYCGGYCSKVNSNTGQCNIVAGLNVPPLKTFVQTWRKHVKKMFECCDAFVTTSQSAYDLYTEFYPELKNKSFKIIEHGRDIETPKNISQIPEFKDNEPIKILLPGHINVNKGAVLIKEIKECDFNDKLELHYMGNIHSGYHLEDYGKYHGYYKRSEFCKEVNKIKPHFIGILSIWPETYCHTLTESWGCGIPVITLNIGALGERVSKNGGGFFIENDGQKAYEKIIRISEDYDKYVETIKQISKITFKSTKKMTEEYMELYANYINFD